MPNNQRGIIKVFSEMRPYRPGGDRSVVVFQQHMNGTESIAKPLEFVDCTDQMIDDGRATIPYGLGTEVLQAMIEHAWSIGLRPAGFSDVPLQTEAIKAHLADMRALVFRQSPPFNLPDNRSKVGGG